MLWHATAVLLLQLAASPANHATHTEVETVLHRQTQELLDAVAPGNVAVWERYLDPDMVYVSEAGEVQHKKELVAQITPMPPGISGHLEIASFDVVVHGDFAVATHEDHESEEYFGQELHSRYRTTDTWKLTDAGWRLVASQVLALLDDPPAIALDAPRLQEYAGSYTLTPAITYTIRRDGARLFGKRSGRDEEELFAEAPDVFFVRGRPRSRKVFHRNASGAVIGYFDRREGHDVVWKVSASATPPPPPPTPH